MTSFELFKLLKLKKICILHTFLYFFLLNYIMSDKLHHFIKKIKYFASYYGITTGFKISKLNYARKAIENNSGRGLKILICINF